MAYVRQAEDGDAFWLAGRLRVADLMELAALERDPMEALSDGYQLSYPHASSISHRGRPIAMFGVVPMAHGLGAVWLLGTPAIADIRTQFLRQSRKWLEEIERPFSGLMNRVHAENELHIKWLRWLGFTFIRQHNGFLEFAKCVTPYRPPCCWQAAEPWDRSASISRPRPATLGRRRSTGSTPRPL